jgi:hypothetical protein
MAPRASVDPNDANADGQSDVRPGFGFGDVFSEGDGPRLYEPLPSGGVGSAPLPNLRDLPRPYKKGISPQDQGKLKDIYDRAARSSDARATFERNNPVQGPSRPDKFSPTPTNHRDIRSYKPAPEPQLQPQTKPQREALPYKEPELKRPFEALPYDPKQFKPPSRKPNYGPYRRPRKRPVGGPNSPKAPRSHPKPQDLKPVPSGGLNPQNPFPGKPSDQPQGDRPYDMRSGRRRSKIPLGQPGNAYLPDGALIVGATYRFSAKFKERTGVTLDFGTIFDCQGPVLAIRQRSNVGGSSMIEYYNGSSWKIANTNTSFSSGSAPWTLVEIGPLVCVANCNGLPDKRYPPRPKTPPLRGPSNDSPPNNRPVPATQPTSPSPLPFFDPFPFPFPFPFPSPQPPPSVEPQPRPKSRDANKEPSRGPSPKLEPKPKPDPTPLPKPRPSPRAGTDSFFPPSPSPNPTPSPNPSPNPDYNPNPNPSPTPSPNPSPNTDFLPNPNPTPTPTPSPTPTPNPNFPRPGPNPTPGPSPKPYPDPIADPNPTPIPDPTIPMQFPPTPGPSPSPPTACEIKKDPCLISIQGAAQGAKDAASQGLQKIDRLADKLEKYFQILDVGLLVVINDKLGPKLPGGMSKWIERIDSVTKRISTTVGAIQEKLGKFSRWARLGQLMNVLTFITTVHNAYMLSNSLGQTFLSMVSNGLAVFGIKDDENQPYDLSSLINKGVEETVKAVVGEANYTTMSTEFKKANRIYQSAANLLFSIQSLRFSIMSALETIGAWSARIGNALRKWGVVGESAYGWMNPSPNFDNKFTQAIQTAEEIVSQVDSVASEVLSAQETVTQIGTQKDELLNSLGLGTEKPLTENKPEKDKATASKAVSASPNIEPTDLVKPGV